MIADKLKEMSPSMAGNSGPLCWCPGTCRSVRELLLLKSLRFARGIKELSEHNVRQMQSSLCGVLGCPGACMGDGQG